MRLSPFTEVAAKIRRGELVEMGEFVEMGELLPEFLVSQREDNLEGKREQRGRRSWKVTNILTWVKCFGQYAIVWSQHAPHRFPELMAYMGAIVTVSQQYAGLAWMRYDSAFRRQAALTGNTQLVHNKLHPLHNLLLGQSNLNPEV